MLKNRRYSIFLLCFICTTSLSCYGTITLHPHGGPWFTGPLLTPSAQVVKQGHYNLEPYLYYIVNDGTYGSDWHLKSKAKFYQWNPQIVFKVGLAEKINLSGTIQGYYNETQGQSSWALADLPLGLDYQLFVGTANDWLSYVKLSLQETLPVGKYQKLNPRKLSTDAGGQGTWGTQIGLCFSKSIHFPDHRFLSLRFNVSGNFFTPIHVKGLNWYGGNVFTNGTVYPGNSVSLYTGAEFTLTQNWALALDLNGVCTAKNRFKGKTTTQVGGPSSVQLSIAPAIEYNWSRKIGVIVGSWFTIGGRNSTRFTSVAAALDYYY